MLPRWHIFYGALFVMLIWLAIPEISWMMLMLIFLSSFLIDFDHYMCAVVKTGKVGLWNAFEYHKRLGIRQVKEKAIGLRRKADFHIFHTVEFHILIGILGFLWFPFFYIFIGMVFHSLLDLVFLIKKGFLYRREYFLTNWLKKKF